MLRGYRHSRTGIAQALAALALLAMVVRALVPAGYMFAPSPGNRFLTVTLCSGSGVAETIVDLTAGVSAVSGDAHHGDGPSNRSGSDAHCLFAVSAALSVPEQPMALPVTTRLAFVAAPQARVVFPGRGLAAPPPWATGPPHTA